MYQKCPVCNGSGEVTKKDYLTAFESNKCSVCEGAKIISQLNGLPPQKSNVLKKDQIDDVQNQLMGIDQLIQPFKVVGRIKRLEERYLKQMSELETMYLSGNCT